MALSPTSSRSGSSPVHTATVTLSDAQIKALPTTPAVYITDPGAGKFAVPVEFVLRMQPAHYVAYTNIDAAATLYLGNLVPPIHEASGQAVSGLLATPDYPDAVAILQFSVAWQDADLTGAQSINAQNTGGDFTGGDAGNSLVVAAAYLVFDTASGAFAA